MSIFFPPSDPCLRFCSFELALKEPLSFSFLPSDPFPLWSFEPALTEPLSFSLALLSQRLLPALPFNWTGFHGTIIVFLALLSQWSLLAFLFVWTGSHEDYRLTVWRWIALQTPRWTLVDPTFFFFFFLFNDHTHSCYPTLLSFAFFFFPPHILAIPPFFFFIPSLIHIPFDMVKSTIIVNLFSMLSYSAVYGTI